MPIPTTWLQFNPTAVPSAAAGVGAGVQINQAELAREALARQAQQQAAQQALARQQLQQQAALQALNQLTAMQRMEMDREQFAINQSRLGQAFELTKEEAERKRREEDRKNQDIIDFQRDIQDPNLDKKNVLEKWLPKLDPTGLSDLYKQYRTSGEPEITKSEIPGLLKIKNPDGTYTTRDDPSYTKPLTASQLSDIEREKALIAKYNAELDNPEWPYAVKKLYDQEAERLMKVSPGDRKSLEALIEKYDKIAEGMRQKKSSGGYKIGTTYKLDKEGTRKAVYLGGDPEQDSSWQML